MWTNIFIIAKTVSVFSSVLRRDDTNMLQLECCITGLQYTHPFKAKTGMINDEIRPQSYGWRLFDNEPLGVPNKNADSELRRVLADCMQEDPIERPSLIQLLKVVNCAEQRGLMTDTDETYDFWWAATDPHEYLANGGVPRPPVEPGAPFSFQQSGGQESQFVNAPSAPVKEAQPAAQRMVLDSDSDPYMPPQRRGSVSRKRASNDGQGDERPKKLQKSNKNSDVEMNDIPLSDVDMKDAPLSNAYYSAKAVQSVDMERRKTPNYEWKDRTGLSDALQRQMALSGQGQKRTGLSDSLQSQMVFSECDIADKKSKLSARHKNPGFQKPAAKKRDSEDVFIIGSSSEGE